MCYTFADTGNIIIEPEDRQLRSRHESWEGETLSIADLQRKDHNAEPELSPVDEEV